MYYCNCLNLPIQGVVRGYSSSQVWNLLKHVNSTGVIVSWPVFTDLFWHEEGEPPSHSRDVSYDE